MATVLADLEDEKPRTITLCCARGDRAQLGPLVERLVARGHHVEVVSDIDKYPEGVLNALKRRGPSALYVLFEGAALSSDKLASMQTQLRTRGVPAHHIRIEKASPSSGPAGSPRRAPPGSPFPAPGAPSLDRSGSQPIAPPPLPGTNVDASTHRPGRLLMGLGLVAAVGIIGGTVAFAMQSDDGTPDAAVLHEETADDPAPERTDALPTKADDAAKPLVVDPIVDEDAMADGGERDGQDDDDEDADDDEQAAIEETEHQDADPPTEADASADVKEISDADAVYRALNDGTIRGLDLLLIAPEPVTKWRKRTIVRKLSFDDATSHCENLDIDGVTGWRLATIGELTSLTAGRMLERGKFWSSTKADNRGQTRIVWNSQTGKMGPAPTKWRGGRTVCVRPSVRPTSIPLDEDDDE